MMYKMKWLFFVSLILFSCGEDGAEIDYTPPIPPPPPTIVATGMLDGAIWEATQSSSRKNDELFNFGLNEQREGFCPFQIISFQNVPLKEGTFPIQSNSSTPQPGVDAVYSFLFLACGDAIEGDYRIEEGGQSSMTILSIDDTIVKGIFQVNYIRSEGFNNGTPDSFELMDVEFEIDL